MHNRTILYTAHKAAGARFTNFAGWEMPLHYHAGWAAEHKAVRNSVGIFDVSHMGRFRVRSTQNTDVSAWLAEKCTADITMLAEGSSTYALLCQNDGGIIDDVFVYRLCTNEFLIVVNASRRHEDRAALDNHPPHISIHDETSETAMIAVQGPRAAAHANQVLPTAGIHIDIDALPRFGITSFQDCYVSRTGYTGEDGVELFLPAKKALPVWNALLNNSTAGIMVHPAGLAARDSLRLEAGFALYGHEIHSSVSPAEARLLWACSFEHAFTGKTAILKRAKLLKQSVQPSPASQQYETGIIQQPLRVLRRLVMQEKGVPRQGFPVFAYTGSNHESHTQAKKSAGPAHIGIIVSGGSSISTGTFIANAYIDNTVPLAAPVLVEIRGKKLRAKQQSTPVYKPQYAHVQSAGKQLQTANFIKRHIETEPQEIQAMLQQLGSPSLKDFIHAAIPQDIRRRLPMRLPAALSEFEVQTRLHALADKNIPKRSLIGMGYAACITPAVIQQNILEAPGWYTAYTPYQSEISQGRLEALMSFQTMITELTGMDIANASLLDEASAAAEALTMAIRARKNDTENTRILVSDSLHPQTIAVLQTRAEPLGFALHIAPAHTWVPTTQDIAGIFQFPDTNGEIHDYGHIVHDLHSVQALAVTVVDILSLTIFKPPAEWSADIAVGSTQRFGLPLFFGGPHAAFIACRSTFKRLLPGRIVSMSKDIHGAPALRLALQTREQHIRRDKATSNICTAQVLPAIVAAMYAVYHGPSGLKRIAERIRLLTCTLRDILQHAGFSVTPKTALFDTLVIHNPPASLLLHAEEAGFNLRVFTPAPAIHTQYENQTAALGITLDEQSTAAELAQLATALTGGNTLYTAEKITHMAAQSPWRPDPRIERVSTFLTQKVFHTYHTETKLLRYITTLKNRDISLAHSMIPLGSCTMKLNPATAVRSITWQGFADIHPYAPAKQTKGYQALIQELSQYLCSITGLHGCTLQPNSGAQGEYTGLMAIRNWHIHNKQRDRDICFIPDSAHGTNPASAVIAGMQVVVIGSNTDGTIDIHALKKHASQYAERLAAMMITFPSTRGVFETEIHAVIDIVHSCGAQVYLDGANMNALAGLISPAELGIDVCHLNLHKTFAIPHGGGGPGVGAVLTASHLTPYLPPDIIQKGMISSAPFGSAGILSISYAYIAMLGSAGLQKATMHAILNANYLASQLQKRIPIAYTGKNHLVAHECVLDFRTVEKETGITVHDIAKRLTDYGFHAPTVSWPLASSLMVEPTESESKQEIDRFCNAMLSIMDEIDAVRNGSIALEESPLRHAPHTVQSLLTAEWKRPYSREAAAIGKQAHKYWPPVGRVDNVYGDKTCICTWKH